MRARLKTSSPPVVTTIILLFSIFLINTTPTFAQFQCCNSPVFGIGVESCGMRGCLECTRGELIVKKQPVDVGNAFGASGTLESASRIVLEDNPGQARFQKLQSLFLNASDYKLFPEPLIRIRNSEVADNAFSLLTNITIFPLEPYCQKGTIFDIDNMKKKPWDRLRKLEKDLLASCPKPTTQAPPPATAPNLPPNSAPSSPQISGSLPKPISGQCSSCPPVPKCPSVPSAEKASDMGRTSSKKHLTDNDKRAIVVGRQNELTMMTLAGMFGVTEACISPFLKRWKAQDGTIKSQRTERPRVIDRNGDRNILKTSRTNPRLTAPAIRREVFLNSPSPPSVSTVKRRLNAAGIMGRRPLKKPLISEKNRAARVKWAKGHLNWTRQDWNKILWSDESKFLLFESDGNQW
ncbi:unnamed protein product, partial [Caenorhabditis auriculariae]